MFSTRWIMTGVAALAAAWGIAGCDNAKTHTGPPPARSGNPGSEKVIGFSQFDIGKTPPGFAAALTGGGGAASWVVQEDPTAPSGKRILAQTSGDTTDYRFPICVYDGVSARDVEASVQFKSVSGKVDEAGGVIVRYRDKDNYYVVRANALEDNVRLYKVANGRRSEITGITTKVSPNLWHKLALSAKGTHFVVSFDDKWFEADDGTFQDAGKVGLWTKADSVTYFDNLKIESYDGR
ncbi:MAG: hypothetical protein HZA50_18670 [Planctomycetes bacterium]|nr:hypothetical protein [Planctomycetota bacterium]